MPEASVAGTVALFEGGATVPFVARYRREATGGLSESQVQAIRDRMVFYRDVEDQRTTVLKTLADRGKLSPEVREKVEGCFSRIELDDFLIPFRAKRKSRFGEAIEKGLEPLAEYLWNQEPDAWTLEEHADVFIDPEKKVTSREEAIRGASDIVAEWIASNHTLRKIVRELVWTTGVLVSKVAPSRADQKSKYGMYYDRREPVTSIPSHRTLAIRRGTKENILTSWIESDDAKALDLLVAATVRDPESVFAPIIAAATRDSYTRLIRPAAEADARARLKERADLEAIRVFQENLSNLLLSPAAGAMTVLGVNSGKASDCKVALVDPSGALLEHAGLGPIPPPDGDEGTRTKLRELISRHGVQALAIGNGTASREVEQFVRQFLREETLDHVIVAGVNDAGLAVFASSRVGREEFPDLDTASRVAVSVARRLQDPLSELVKIDPKLIGVGQYQHEVDQKELHRKLVQTVQSCVNRVGIDLNTASASLLRFTAGFNDSLARKVVAHRQTQGAFTTLAALLGVAGVNEKTFHQAAGFLRVRSGENPLDRTAVHPECYAIVEKMAVSLGVQTGELVENGTLVSSLKLEEFAAEPFGLPTLNDIREELLKPGRDPRKIFAVAKFREDVKDIADLKEGMSLEGTVTNVTNFGAFVDIGVRHDGLVHLSQMSNRFIRDPRTAVGVGDVVQVKVISVEPESKRIGLSMRALLPVIPKRKKKPRRKPAPAPAPVVQAAPPAAESPATGIVEAAASAGAAPVRAPREEFRGRPHRRPKPHRERPGPPRESRQAVEEAETPAENTEPEKTLHEKIAILQSKFRGIS